MIEIRNLNKAFGKLPVLRGIDLSFSRPGRITAVLGPNGSGKTTLSKTILGMVIPDSGEVVINGRNIRNEWAYRSAIDYLPQIARFPENLTAGEVIDLIKDLRGGQTREQELIRLFGLEPYLDSRLHNLSGGTKQKVNLVLALMYDSPILILDEPTSGLDPVALTHFKDLLAAERARGKMILMTTHIMSLVEEVADEIVFLLDGRIYFRGTVEQVKAEQGEESLERAIAAILSQKAAAAAPAVRKTKRYRLLHAASFLFSTWY